jgi:hypothetical protein
MHITYNLTLHFVRLNGLITILIARELKQLLYANFVYLDGRLYEWYIENAQTELMNYQFLSLIKCKQGFHNLISMPLKIKSRMSPPSIGQFTPCPTSTNTLTYTLTNGAHHLSLSTAAKKRATYIQFPPHTPLHSYSHFSLLWP